MVDENQARTNWTVEFVAQYGRPYPRTNWTVVTVAQCGSSFRNRRYVSVHIRMNQIRYPLPDNCETGHITLAVSSVLGRIVQPLCGTLSDRLFLR
jgi:hypothetical protein